MAALRWFRGNLHAHSYWSDGRGFPEQAIDTFRAAGYHFLALTEHNRYADDPDTWRDVAAAEGPWPPQVTAANFQAYLAAHGPAWVEQRQQGATTQIRLKTAAELAAHYNRPDQFLLLPGVEITQVFQGRHVHVNYLNLPRLLPALASRALVQEATGVGSVAELLTQHAAAIAQLAADQPEPALVMLNHPHWRYCDLAPRDLIECPAIRFCEVCSGGADFAELPETAGYNERFWDVVTAHRCRHGLPPVYGIAGDDAHFYDAARSAGDGGVGDAWIMVRAPALTPAALLAALARGDFYCTCGVLLDEVRFDAAARTLEVTVQAQPDTAYEIDFIVTSRDYDDRCTEVALPAAEKRPARVVPQYDAGIGRVARTVPGPTARYRLTDDDLYVRARVRSTRPARFQMAFHPTVQMAWTQPCRAIHQRTADATGPATLR